nr:MAG TPA: hypothetical protein [Caudoviricetes sp.]
MNINDMMNKMGFGESSLTRKKNNFKLNPTYTKEPNVAVYADSYAYIVADPYREALQLKNIEDKLGKIKSYCESRGIAFSEDLDDIKDTVKDGWERFKNTLRELYEKAIRFFTETVRYWFSNEKKIGKKLAVYRAAQKKNIKSTGKVNLPTFLSNGITDATTLAQKAVRSDKAVTILSTYINKKKDELDKIISDGDGKSDDTDEKKSADLATITQNVKAVIDGSNKDASTLSEDEKAVYHTYTSLYLASYLDALVVKSDGDLRNEEDYQSVKDRGEEILTSIKDYMEESNESSKEDLKGKGYEVDLSTGAENFGKIVKNALSVLITALELQRKLEGSSMRNSNKMIRKYQDELRKLKKEYKENKSGGDDETRKLYQRDRQVLVQKIKMTNFVKSAKDRYVGILFKYGDAAVSAINKAAGGSSSNASTGENTEEEVIAK